MIPKWVDYACQIWSAAFVVVMLYSFSSFVLCFILPFSITRLLPLGDWVEPASLLAIVSSSVCALVGCLICGVCIVFGKKAPERLAPLTLIAVIFAVLLALLTPAIQRS